MNKQPPPTTYAWYVGSVYIFNQMIGTGLLAMPKAFVEVGWILGLTIPCVLAFMSYCTATYVIETHAIHNAISKCTSFDDDASDNEIKHVVVVYEKDSVRNDVVVMENGVVVKDTDAMLGGKGDQPRIHKDSGCVSDDGSFLEYGSEDGGSVISFSSFGDGSDQLFPAIDNEEVMNPRHF